MNSRHAKFREFDRWLLRLSEEHPFQFEALSAAIGLGIVTLIAIAEKLLRLASGSP